MHTRNETVVLPNAVRSGPVATKPDGRPVHVLVVDDEPAIIELLWMVLRYEGWRVSCATDGATAVRAVRELMPDLVILDMMLPDIDGLEVLPLLRAVRPGLPVLFLTAKDSVDDRVAGLSAGGDDYVTKPFSVEEVLLRLRTLVRHTGIAAADSATKLVVGDLALDERSREVTRSGDEIVLTATEYQLLLYMMENPGRVLTKAQILDDVWNYDFAGRSNVVELYISYLRKKIDAGRRPMIHTMRGVGYVLKPC
jgi:two-component system OmpR family response regulator